MYHKYLPLVLLLCTPLWASDGIYFIDLSVTPDHHKVTIESKPVRLADQSVLQDKTLQLSREFMASLDAPFQAAFTVAREMDQVRAQRARIMADIAARAAKAAAKNGLDVPHETAWHMERATAPEYVAGFTFTVAIRNLRGKEMDQHQSSIRIGLSPNPGYLVVDQDDFSVRQISFESLNNREVYEDLLQWMVMPESVSLKEKGVGNQGIVDLYYQCGEVNPELIDKYNLLDSLVQYHILNRISRLERKEQLGTTYRFKEGGKVREVRSGHLNIIREVIRRYNLVKDRTNHGENVIADLRELVEMAPAETGFLTMLARELSNRGQRDEAYKLLRRLEPLVESSPDTAKIYRELQAIREGQRRALMARRNSFSRSDTVSISILSPQPRDYVGEGSEVVFALIGKHARMVQAELYVNDQLHSSITDGPLILPLNPDGKRKHLGLRVVAWFKDRTYAEMTMAARYIYIAAEEHTNLISLRTLATRGGSRFLADLDETDFRVMEFKQDCDIVRFRKDRAPLRIAVLVDTSGSMVGEKIYKAQYALNSFLSKLEAEDSATVYAFDHKVVRFKPFTNKYADLRPMIFTMRPQMTTSLHDAVMVAQNDLRDLEGTKVIIILSDGNDSTSKTNASKLKNSLRWSNSLVYPIILDRKDGLNQMGADFLDELAQITGSITTELDHLNNLDKAFERIYQELKSFYFIDFYSRQAEFDPDKVKIRVKRGNGRARFRQYLNQDELLFGEREIAALAHPATNR